MWVLWLKLGEATWAVEKALLTSGLGGQEAVRVRAHGSELRPLSILPWKPDVGVRLRSRKVLRGVSCIFPHVSGVARSRVVWNEMEPVMTPVPMRTASNGLRWETWEATQYPQGLRWPGISSTEDKKLQVPSPKKPLAQSWS